MDVNSPIDLSDNFQSEIKYNRYGGLEIGKPDYHLNYENRGFEINNEGEINNNVDGNNKSFSFGIIIIVFPSSKILLVFCFSSKKFKTKEREVLFNSEFLFSLSILLSLIF